MKIKFKNANYEDIKYYQDILYEIHNKVLPIFLPPDYIKIPKRSYKTIYLNKNKIGYIEYEDGYFYGEVKIKKIFVNEEYRGKGITTLIVKKLLENYEVCIAKVYLEFSKKIFKNIGFQVVEKRQECNIMAINSDKLLMMKEDYGKLKKNKLYNYNLKYFRFSRFKFFYRIVADNNTFYVPSNKIEIVKKSKLKRFLFYSSTTVLLLDFLYYFIVRRGCFNL